MEKKRDKLEVIRDILMVIRAGAGKIKPTKILYKSNLSHKMMKEYITDMLQKQFIKETKTEDSRTYAITDKGNEYLSKYNIIVSFMDSFGLKKDEEN